MEKTSYHNVYAVVTGILMLLTCCSIAYFFQKNLFSTHRGKVPNAMNKFPSDKR